MEPEWSTTRYTAARVPSRPCRRSETPALLYRLTSAGAVSSTFLRLIATMAPTLPSATGVRYFVRRRPHRLTVRPTPSEEPAVEPESAVTTCYRHPKVESHVRCTRCDRYICPDCMREAAVGHQCVECVKEGARSVRQARTVFGGRIAAVPVVTYVLIGLNVLAYLVELVRPAFVDRFEMLGR